MLTAGVEAGVASPLLAVAESVLSEMWQIIEVALSMPLPIYVKRLLDLEGFGNFISLKELEKEDLECIENYVTSGKLLKRVGAQNLQYYLPDGVQPSDFFFSSGTKKLLKKVVEYVNANHKLSDKNLATKRVFTSLKGNDSAVPLKKAILSPTSHDTISKSSACGVLKPIVPSLDFLSEICCIQKILLSYCKPREQSKLYIPRVKSLQMSVKVFESMQGSGLKAEVKCFLCGKIQTCHRYLTKTWQITNLTRHLKAHVKKEKGIVTIDSMLKSKAPTDASLDEPDIFVDSEDDCVDDDLLTADELALNSNVAFNESLEAKDTNAPDNLPAQTIVSKTVNDSTNKLGMYLGPYFLPQVQPATDTKSDYFSRSQRNKRALQHHCSGQTLLTGYYPLLESIQAIVAKQEGIIESLSGFCQVLIKSNTEKETAALSNLSFLLKILYETALKNSDRQKKGNRYPGEIYMFASDTLLTAGPMFYEKLQANLPDSLPCISEVRKFVAKTADPVREGVFRFEELKQFLQSRNLPLKVWLSEDGTRMISKFEYDIKSNQIVGPVLPLSEAHGTPVLNTFPASSAAMIAKHFINGTPADIAYVIMAQPLDPSAPSFCLAVFGTDNRFKAEHVSRRWDFITKSLQILGIEVIGVSSDGDSKLLKAMRAETFPTNPTVPEIFKDVYFCDTTKPITMIQDTIHLLNRFKTRLNKASIVLPMGKFVASSSHLRIIVNNVSKAEHGLCEYDLTKEDKMNFNATMKMCADRTTSAIEKHVPGSEATLVYLDIMKKIETAFLDSTLLPLKRVYNVWYALFFVRIWKGWIKQSKEYRMDRNFITQNMYIGLEINAHGLIKVMRRLRDMKYDHLFLPLLMSSQHCEKFFGKARSITTTQSTVINFTMLGFLQKIKKIEFLLDLNSKMSDNFDMPRERRKALLQSAANPDLRNEPLPLDMEIKEAMDKAMADAKTTALRLGMAASVPNVMQYLHSELDLCDDFYDVEETVEMEQSDDGDFDEEDDIPLDILSVFPPDVPSNIDLSGTENSENVCESPLPPDSKYVKVFGANGSINHMLKSTLCWILRNDGPKISNDRVMRYRQQALKSFKRPHQIDQVNSVIHNENLSVGDFVLFGYPRKSGLRIGQILSFCYLSGQNCSYSLTSAPTLPPVQGARGLGVLCTWFRMSPNGFLSVIPSNSHTYTDIKMYKFTVPPPVISDGGVLISREVQNLL